jgi:hypothetical protein
VRTLRSAVESAVNTDRHKSQSMETSSVTARGTAEDIDSPTERRNRQSAINSLTVKP